ncbi:MAG: glycosyltransferase [Archangiaceae bacterium]|nr:glycosyltransferase [Archangiaceae bacterium]
MNRRLKIVYVLDSAGTARAGGLVSGDRIIAGLREHHDVTSVGLNGDVKLPLLTLPGVDDLVRANSFAFARPDAQRLREVISGADVVHVQLPFFLGFSAVRIARALGVPVVTAHHVQPENVLAQASLRWPRLMRRVGGPWLCRLMNRAMVWSFHRHADLVICPSQLARDELRKAGLKAPTEVISNGAPDRFAPLPRREPGRFTVLSVGRLVPEKRHDLIIEAVAASKHARELRLVIAGKGPLQPRLEALAAESPAEVKLGFVSDDELLSLYQHADLYVHASEVELEGMAALEAMRCGCPALIADAPESATKQFAIDAWHLFTPGDAWELARRIDDCFEHRAQLEAMRETTLAFVHGYGLASIIARYEAVYQQVIDRYRLRQRLPAAAPPPPPPPKAIITPRT